MANSTVALVGGDTLLARDLRELLAEILPKPRVVSISSAPPAPTPKGASPVLAAQILADEEEAIAVLPLTAENLDGARVAVLAGTASASRRALKINPSDGPKLIDLSGALEDQPDARLRAPSVEAAGNKPEPRNIQVIAHPAAIALTMLLARLGHAGTIRKAVVHVFEPASERGQQGIEELRKQTTSVLTFQKLPTDVFDAQLAFNLLAAYGEEALEPLDSVEHRLESHLASLLHAWPGIPMPSIRLIQAPVFHGHSMSVWVEFEVNPGAASITKLLAASGLDVREEDPPTNVAVAGQSGISVGAIRDDHNNSKACWFWVVSDNVRLAAENAVAVAREMI